MNSGAPTIENTGRHIKLRGNPSTVVVLKPSAMLSSNSAASWPPVSSVAW
jgi:hypothetical protein